MTRHAYVIGAPIGHSLSPYMHNAAFAACGIDAAFESVEVRPAGLERWVTNARASDVLGFNVTVPHKETIIPILDRIDDEAARAGAVNTVIVGSGGQGLIGANTDIVGFRRSLKLEAGATLRDQAIVLLGAGGAARAIAVVALEDEARSLVVANRHIERAQRLLADLANVRHRTAIHAVDIRDVVLVGALHEATVVVNATSVGLQSSDMPVDLDSLSPDALVVDIVYNPPRTAFLRAAERRGARVLGGLGMLVYQAAASFERWTGVAPPISTMRAAAEGVLRGA